VAAARVVCLVWMRESGIGGMCMKATNGWGAVRNIAKGRCDARLAGPGRAIFHPERFPFLRNRKRALDSCICRIVDGEPLHTSPENVPDNC
jgi:hypothetical protein